MATPFLSIKDACKETGLSQFYLRQGCKDGSIPCIRCGTKLMINVPLLMQRLNQESSNAKNCTEADANA